MTVADTSSEPSITAPAAARGAPDPKRARAGWSVFLHFQLHALGFIATVLLLSWGMTVAALLALGNFSFDGLMAQLANLTTRYVAADAARQSEFKLTVGAAELSLAVTIMVLRRHALLPPRQGSAR